MSKLTAPQKAGLSLIVLAVSAAIFVQVATGNLVRVTGHRLLGASHGRYVSTETYGMDVAFTWKYALPIAVVATAGLAGLFIPWIRGGR